MRSASVEVGDAPAKGEGRIRRAFCSPDKLVERPAAGLNTMADVFAHSLKRKCVTASPGTMIVSEPRLTRKSTRCSDF